MDEVAEGRPSAPGGRPPGLRRTLTLLAWSVPAALVLFAAYKEFASDTGPAGSLSVASYRAQAQVEASPAPDFELEDLQGFGDITLSEMRGDVVVVNFWASWCAPCRQEAPDLERTWKMYKGRGVRFLGVDENDDAAAARTFVSEFGLTYPSVFDPAGRLAAGYRLLGLPTTVIIDQEGQIVYRFTGFVTEPVLSSALDDVLERRET